MELDFSFYKISVESKSAKITVNIKN